MRAVRYSVKRRSYTHAQHSLHVRPLVAVVCNALVASSLRSCEEFVYASTVYCAACGKQSRRARTHTAVDPYPPKLHTATRVRTTTSQANIPQHHRRAVVAAAADVDVDGASYPPPVSVCHVLPGMRRTCHRKFMKWSSTRRLVCVCLCVCAVLVCLHFVCGRRSGRKTATCGRQRAR